MKPPVCATMGSAACSAVFTNTASNRRLLTGAYPSLRGVWRSLQGEQLRIRADVCTPPSNTQHPFIIVKHWCCCSEYRCGCSEYRCVCVTLVSRVQ